MQLFSGFTYKTHDHKTPIESQTTLNSNQPGTICGRDVCVQLELNTRSFIYRNRAVRGRAWSKICATLTFHIKPLPTVDGGRALVNSRKRPLPDCLVRTLKG